MDSQKRTMKNMLNCNFLFLLLISIFLSDKVETAYWSEEQYEIFEDILLTLVDEHFDNTRRLSKRATTACPGGNGKFGFNSYQLLTNIVLGFSAVSSIIANINNNLNNNNNNNNQNDVGNVQGSSQVMKIPGLFFTKHSPFQFDILFLNLVHVFRTQI